MAFRQRAENVVFDLMAIETFGRLQHPLRRALTMDVHARLVISVGQKIVG